MKSKKLILGTVQMGLPYGVNNSTGQVTTNNSHIILAKAFNEGITILDTAESYGNAHQVIGDFHRLNPDIKFKVITKISPSEKTTSIERKIELFLDSLNINNLEALMFHSFQSYTKNREILQQLVKLKKNGIVNQVGVSLYTNEELEKILKDDHIDLIQIPFNLFDNFNLRGELMFEAKNRGKTIHTRSAFLQGLFFKDPDEEHPIVKALKMQLEDINKISKTSGYPIASIALNYCLQQEYIDKVLIGVDSLKQLKSNLETLNVHLPESIIELINNISIKNLNILNPSLWKN